MEEKVERGKSKVDEDYKNQMGGSEDLVKMEEFELRTEELVEDVQREGLGEELEKDISLGQ